MRKSIEKSQKPEKAASEVLECQRRLLRVRLEIAELKRVGSQQGLSNLASEATRLSMRIRRLKVQA